MESEERRFTLRITDDESLKLEELKEYLNITTDSAVIRYLINNYKEMSEKKAKKDKECCGLLSKNNDLINAIAKYFDSEYILKKLVFGDD